MKLWGWELRKIPKEQHIKANSRGSWGVTLSYEEGELTKEQLTIHEKALKSWVRYAEGKEWNPFKMDGFMTIEIAYVDAFYAGFTTKLGGA